LIVGDKEAISVMFKKGSMKNIMTKFKSPIKPKEVKKDNQMSSVLPP
jgi:hypothetical protein